MSRRTLGVIFASLLALIVVAGPVAAKPYPGGTYAVTPPLDQFTEFTQAPPHAAFPTVAKLADGTLRMMWRHGSAHASADGVLMTATGSPDGSHWSIPVQVQLDTPGDLRDPHLSRPGPSGDVFLTYFASVNGAPTGARVARSVDGGATFGPSARIDPGFPRAAISSGVVRVGTKLMTAFYGRPAGDLYDTAWIAWSLDGGTTWAVNRIMNGLAAKVQYQEPTILTDGTKIRFLFRNGTWNAIGMRASDDGGTTWKAPQYTILPHATGNSAGVWASTGVLYTVYRDTTTRDAVLASSWNQGATWQVRRTVLRQPDGADPAAIGFAYGSPIELSPGGPLFFPAGMETEPSDSRIFLGYI